MYTASLENCKRLYELSGWESKDLAWHIAEIVAGERQFAGRVRRDRWSSEDVPAYDLGNMLRKLPRKLVGYNSRERDGNLNLYASWGKASWVASYADGESMIVKRKKLGAETNNHRNYWFVQANADTPEDAACLLAIQLFEQKILTPTTFNGGHDE